MSALGRPILINVGIPLCTSEFNIQNSEFNILSPPPLSAQSDPICYKALLDQHLPPAYPPPPAGKEVGHCPYFEVQSSMFNILPSHPPCSVLPAGGLRPPALPLRGGMAPRSGMWETNMGSS